MVAVIKVSGRMQRIINYNENKVKQGKAVCIAAVNYPLDAPFMTIAMKMKRLMLQMELNRNVMQNTLHISLNFDASENGLSTDKLKAIAGSYMEKLGFGNQPYLVYQHHDAGHPHIHLVTTNIESSGKRIDLHHLAIRKSEPARKEVETEFGLVKAQDKKRHTERLQAVSAKKITYGTTETKAAIQNVLDVVIDKYSYTSLAELNAVLGLYNVRADNGKENSSVNRHKGLLYHIIDKQGNATGVPIKASLFYSRPTLSRLSTKFISNKITAQPKKARIMNVIDKLSYGNTKAGFQDLENSLSKEGIALVKRVNEQGFIYGITYIDHSTGGVFNGSTLGKQYSAKAIQERFPVGRKTEKQAEISVGESLAKLQNIRYDAFINPIIKDISRIIESFTKAEQSTAFLPREFKRKKKRRRRKGPSDNN
ncbi:relaxase/mobilization nuclease domain-containing protein [Flavobacterium beibuense]|uniref:Relaxase/mobilization nuclease family protein n=1 Tax=Flavobacterium beibuense TaxID=657326 RepID=A0A444WEN6_9FLAO|nr:relaxase/mobilization nuclease domain-containing protein [Flavobacterium beibuense]RYJ44275.1 Relaxase/mobilization nuclease family protein [Flavobacterium beibuense]